MNLNHVSDYISTACAHPSWEIVLKNALSCISEDYLEHLRLREWLPGPQKALSAFSLPLPETRFILFGEGPYPRPRSATGYAFMDGQVDAIWSSAGFSKHVNRATSLRNFLKMILVADGFLYADDHGKDAVANVDNTGMVKTITDLQNNFLREGFLLLNASLAFTDKAGVKRDFRGWRPFVSSLMAQLAELGRTDIHVLLFGKIADQLVRDVDYYGFSRTIAEHPYNLSFIKNPAVHAVFKNRNLLNLQ